MTDKKDKAAPPPPSRAPNCPRDLDWPDVEETEDGYLVRGYSRRKAYGSLQGLPWHVPINRRFK